MGLLETKLEIGDEVRFRHNPEHNWVKGKVVGTNKDGSIYLYDDGGHGRHVMPAKLERKVKGPRGGIKWETV